MALEEENQTPSRILRLREVLMKVGLGRASIYRAIAAGTFPKPLALGERARGWLESAINQWVASRTTANRNQSN